MYDSAGAVADCKLEVLRETVEALCSAHALVSYSFRHDVPKIKEALNGQGLQQGGYHVIWFGLNWSLELYRQVNARLHRQGQTHPVIVRHLAVEGAPTRTYCGRWMKKIPRKKRCCRRLKRGLRRRKPLDCNLKVKWVCALTLGYMQTERLKNRRSVHIR